MEDAVLYDSSSQFQKRETSKVLSILLTSMMWSRMGHAEEEMIVMDFGCGSGSTTKNILLPALQAKTKRTVNIIGIDISNEMIQFAKSNYDHPNISYRVLDLLRMNEIGLKSFSKIDKIFSFFVLHWIQDLQKLMKVFFKLLKPNGEIGLYFVLSSKIFNVFEKMSGHPDWIDYVRDSIDFIPKNWDGSENGNEGLIVDIMTKSGFHVKTIQAKNQEYKFKNKDSMFDFVLSLHPCTNKIPKHKLENYIKDLGDCVTPIFAETDSHGGIQYKHNHQLIYVVAQKSNSKMIRNPNHFSN